MPPSSALSPIGSREFAGFDTVVMADDESFSPIGSREFAGFDTPRAKQVEDALPIGSRAVNPCKPVPVTYCSEYEF